MKCFGLGACLGAGDLQHRFCFVAIATDANRVRRSGALDPEGPGRGSGTSRHPLRAVALVERGAARSVRIPDAARPPGRRPRRAVPCRRSRHCTAHKFGRSGCRRARSAAWPSGASSAESARSFFSPPENPSSNPTHPTQAMFSMGWLGFEPDTKGSCVGLDFGEKSFVFNVVPGVPGSEAGFRASEKSDAVSASVAGGR